ncbi:MAG TPA: RES domain-containing protein [Longimicrobiaceae bacterium]|nr:RES domain-containing protein [Longimicrobiaceae bacterium]
MSLVAYRVCKARYPAFDGTGASLVGGRWNSPGRPVVYCSDSYAGALLEILVHAGQRIKLPGPHHAVEARLPDDIAVEDVQPDDLPGWDAADGDASRGFGDRWLAEGRSVVLRVPAVTAQPFGRNLLVNPAHPDAGRIHVPPPVVIQWDARLFASPPNQELSPR